MSNKLSRATVKLWFGNTARKLFLTEFNSRPYGFGDFTTEAVSSGPGRATVTLSLEKSTHNRKWTGVCDHRFIWFGNTVNNGFAGSNVHHREFGSIFTAGRGKEAGCATAVHAVGNAVNNDIFSASTLALFWIFAKYGNRTRQWPGLWNRCTSFGNTVKNEKKTFFAGYMTFKTLESAVFAPETGK